MLILSVTELQMQYSNFKDTLQNIASQIGNVEQEVDEHKYVSYQFPCTPGLLALVDTFFLACFETLVLRKAVFHRCDSGQIQHQAIIAKGTAVTHRFMSLVKLFALSSHLLAS